MKRNPDLIRSILQNIESLPGGLVRELLDVDGFSEEQIGYHCYLIVDAGLADGSDGTSLADTSPNWSIHCLTAAGHDFLDGFDR